MYMHSTLHVYEVRVGEQYGVADLNTFEFVLTTVKVGVHVVYDNC